MSNPSKCQGIIGRLFGHKFAKLMWMELVTYESDCCWRCGMPRGGWR